jgi:hypothetical protein
MKVEEVDVKTNDVRSILVHQKQFSTTTEADIFQTGLVLIRQVELVQVDLHFLNVTNSPRQ